MGEFRRQMHVRYPWLDVKWNNKYGDLIIRPNYKYNGDPDNHNPVWFKIYLDGKLLRDVVMSEARKYGDNSIDSIVRLDAPMGIAGVELSPPEGYPDPNNEVPDISSNQYRVSFTVSSDLARATKENSNVDVQLVRMYKFKTHSGNPFYFPAVDKY
jgi:hypothetical protein